MRTGSCFINCRTLKLFRTFRFYRVQGMSLLFGQRKIPSGSCEVFISNPKADKDLLIFMCALIPWRTPGSYNSKLIDSFHILMGSCFLDLRGLNQVLSYSRNFVIFQTVNIACRLLWSASFKLRRPTDSLVFVDVLIPCKP